MSATPSTRSDSDRDVGSESDGITIHWHNNVYLNGSIIKNVQWIPGQLMVSTGQSSGQDPTIEKTDDGWKIDVYCGRQNTKAVADSFNEINISSQHMWSPTSYFTDEPEELNFYVGVNVEIDVYGIPQYIDIYFGQGHTFGAENWWMASPMLAVKDGRVIPILSTADQVLTILEAKSENSNTFSLSSWFERSAPPWSAADWLKDVSDDLSIGAVNLPGTHDSAALEGSVIDIYGCQNASLTLQMTGGIRLFDIRLKVKQDDNKKYYFMTCHGAWDFYVGMNEYQTFLSAMDEFSKYLAAHSTEFLVVSLKIDDWDGFEKEINNVLTDLRTVLQGYDQILMRSPKLPKVSAVRGKIYLLSRLLPENIDNYYVEYFGAPLEVPSNPEGALIAPIEGTRDFEYYVQDWYEKLPSGSQNKSKFDTWKHASEQKPKTEMVFNFASATVYLAMKVYIMGYIIEYFGQKAASSGRPSQLGWSLFDYAFNQYQTTPYGPLNVVQLFISSNFNWKYYGNAFVVNNSDRVEL